MTPISKSEQLKKTNKHFPSSVREWNNSIYVYNKNTLSSIPTSTVSAMKILRSYFDLFNRKLERKVRSKGVLRRYRRISSNRIYLSKGEFKHTNNRVMINIYLYNRQKYNYLNKLKGLYLVKLLNKRKLLKKGGIYVGKTHNRSLDIRREIVGNNSINKKIISSIRYIYKNAINLLDPTKKRAYVLVRYMKDNSESKIKRFGYVSRMTATIYRKVLAKSIKRLFVYLYYRQLLYINKSKFNYTYLQVLKTHLEKLYNKNVEFNLVNLKDMFLNSDIMSEVARLKLTRNRKRLSRLMNSMRDKIRINSDLIRIRKADKSKSSDITLLYDLRANKNILKESVVNKLKYKNITGYRLEARGRLTKRHKASRSVTKVKYKGNLSNIDSSINKISSVILKGNLRANLQYSKCYSKTRTGTFGLKGWVSGY